MKTTYIDKFLNMFRALPAVEYLCSNKNISEEKKEAAIKAIRKCSKRMCDFYSFELWQTENCVESLMDEITGNLIEHPNDRPFILIMLLDRIISNTYVPKDGHKLHIHITCYGETTSFDLWDIYDINESYKEHEHLIYLYQCNASVLDFMDLLERYLLALGIKEFTFKGDENDKWHPTKVGWRQIQNGDLKNRYSDNLDRQYSEELQKLFHNHIYLIDELVGKSDDEIASLIKKWAKEKDRLGNAKIENPENRLKSAFARELEQAGIIKLSGRTFRDKL